MDNLSIDIGALVIDGESVVDEDRVAIAICAQSDEALTADALSTVSRAILQSVRAGMAG